MEGLLHNKMHTDRIVNFALKRVRENVKVDEETFHDSQLDLSVHVDVVTEALIFRLNHYYAEKEGEPIEYKYPASWWESFKLAWFPKWMLKRFPPLYYKKIIDTSIAINNIDVSEAILKNYPVQIRYTERVEV